jgi:NADPH:quinone reductase-like Zn-dependent oxidoreductase
MKALFFEKHGNISNLKTGELANPSPGPGQVMVRVHTAALNHLDLWVLEGWKGLNLEMPHIPGADGAGEIAALGDGVKGLSIGDRVVINANLSCGSCRSCLAGQDNMCQDWHLLGETVRGTCAEFVCVPAENVLQIPKDFSCREAAAAGLVFLTAWHSLITRANLQPGEKVLLVGASGGVNTASIQIAKLAGAQVFVVGSNAEKLDLAASLGADVLIDRSDEESWSRSIYRLTNKQGVDIVVDNVGSATFPSSLRALRKGGRLLTVGNTSGPALELDNRFIFGKHLSILGSTMGTKEDFYQVMQLLFQGKLKPVLDLDFSLEDAQQAFTRLAQGQQMGKITLEIS